MPRGNKHGVRMLDKAGVNALRAEILTLLDEKGQIPQGATEVLAKKYNIGGSSIGWHKRQAQKGIVSDRRGTPANANGHVAAQEPQQSLDLRRPASREDIDFDAINKDIDAGMTAEEIRGKHGISAYGLERLKREKADEEPITPLNPAQCKRVIEVIAKLAEAHPDKFTRLDFLGQISKKYGSILAEII